MRADVRGYLQTVARHRSKAVVLQGVAFTQFGLFLSGIIVARLLGPQGRGEVASVTLIASLASFAAIGSAPGLLAVLSRARLHDAASLLKGAAVALLPSVCTASLVGAAVTYTVLHNVLLSVASALCTVFLALGAVAYSPYAANSRYAMAAVGQAITPIVYVVALVAIAAADSLSSTSAVLGWLLALVVGFLACPLVWRRRDGLIGLESKRTFLKRSYQGLIGTYSPLEAFRLDQVLVGLMLSSQALGVYVTALAVANLPKLLGQSIGLLVPASFQSLNRRRLDAVSLSLLLSGVVLGLCAPLVIPLLFGHEYDKSVGIAVPLCIAGGAMASRKFLTEICRVSGREATSSISEGAASVVFLLLGFLTAPHAGVLSIALLLMVCTFASTLYVWVQTRSLVSHG